MPLSPEQKACLVQANTFEKEAGIYIYRDLDTRRHRDYQVAIAGSLFNSEYVTALAVCLSLPQ